MNVNAQLTAIRELSDTSTGPGDTVRMHALINAFRDLDAHLSAGGTPPEAWREGLDAPGAGSRYWTMPADPDAGHPEPYGAGTYGLVDEEAGGVVAWILTRDRADALAESLNR